MAMLCDQVVEIGDEEEIGGRTFLFINRNLPNYWEKVGELERINLPCLIRELDLFSR